MTSLSSQAVDYGLDPLSRNPTELLMNIFSLLPRFSDVFALAATCHRLRHVWTTSTDVIYRQVAPRCVPCERYARIFLADQGGPAKEESSMLSAEDVRRLVRNSWAVGKSISEFERNVVCKVRSMSLSESLGEGNTILIFSPAGPWDAEKCYGAQRHPPYLTRTERPRFIRSYYQLWSLMKLDTAKWRSRLEAASLKQLMLLYEMSNLTQSIEPGEGRSDPELQHHTSFRRSDKRIELSREIRKHMDDRYRCIHDQELDDPWVLAKSDGYLNFIVMWDHWQQPFKDLIWR